MADAIIFNAETRDRAGKGAARAIRRAGRVPAIIYGNKQDPEMISIDPTELMLQLRRQGFFGKIFDVQVGEISNKVLARDVQFDPVSERPLHVDFMRFSADTLVNVDVVVKFLNEDTCVGIKKGGMLNLVRRTVELVCPPDAIPTAITIDLADVEVGESIHISAFELPEGVRAAIIDRDFTVATITMPGGGIDEDEEKTDGEEEVEEAATEE